MPSTNSTSFALTSISLPMNNFQRLCHHAAIVSGSSSSFSTCSARGWNAKLKRLQELALENGTDEADMRLRMLVALFKQS